MPTATPTTIRTPGALAHELARVRLMRYARVAGEWRQNIHSVAVAVPSRTGWPTVALSLAVPPNRMDARTDSAPTHQKHLLAHLCSAAQALAGRINHLTEP
ncbi:IclR family transcriptional regulator C-terminal domain-containing protein [Streptomyces sp. NPDC001508]|uniref:IclR family transcriptional regulator domain-containing protein n=1 Tax=Streptomyces sp. NPDC001508 TaxID=3154656 RepID=UPI00332BCF48